MKNDNILVFIIFFEINFLWDNYLKIIDWLSWCVYIYDL